MQSLSRPLAALGLLGVAARGALSDFKIQFLTYDMKGQAELPPCLAATGDHDLYVVSTQNHNLGPDPEAWPKDLGTAKCFPESDYLRLCVVGPDDETSWRRDPLRGETRKAAMESQTRLQIFFNRNSSHYKDPGDDMDWVECGPVTIRSGVNERHFRPVRSKRRVPRTPDITDSADYKFVWESCGAVAIAKVRIRLKGNECNFLATSMGIANVSKDFTTWDKVRGEILCAMTFPKKMCRWREQHSEKLDRFYLLGKRGDSSVFLASNHTERHSDPAGVSEAAMWLTQGFFTPEDSNRDPRMMVHQAAFGAPQWHLISSKEVEVPGHPDHKPYVITVQPGLECIPIEQFEAEYKRHFGRTTERTESTMHVSMTWIESCTSSYAPAVTVLCLLLILLAYCCLSKSGKSGEAHVIPIHDKPRKSESQP